MKKIKQGVKEIASFLVKKNERISKLFMTIAIAAMMGFMTLHIGLAVPVYGAQVSYDGFAEYTPAFQLQEGETRTPGYEYAPADVQGYAEESEWAVLRLDIGYVTYYVNGGYTNGGSTQFYQAPFMDTETNQVMVPLRFVAEALGATVGWIDAIRTITIDRGHVSLSIQVDSDLPNGMGPPLILYGRTFVPLGYVVEILGVNVRWSEDSRVVYIDYPIAEESLVQLHLEPVEYLEEQPAEEDIVELLVEEDTYEPLVEEALYDDESLTEENGNDDNDAREENEIEALPEPPIEDVNYYEEREIEDDIPELPIDEDIYDPEEKEVEDIPEPPIDEDPIDEDPEEKEIEDIPEPPIDEDPEDEKEIEDIEQLPELLQRPQVHVEPQSQELYAFGRRLLALTNLERARHGIAPLVWDSDLARASLIHSTDMARNNFVSHVGSNGLTPGGRVRLESNTMTRVAENIAGGTRTPERTVEAWMRSPGHRANILNEEFVYMGVGIYVLDGTQWGIYITQKFGR